MPFTDLPFRALPPLLRRLWLGCAAMLLAACAALPPATHTLASFDPQGGYRFTAMERGADNSSSLFVVLTFSGGGTRAAALAYGVLDELAHIDIEWEGRRRRLLDEVDLISSVSGGSVTAAYYALHGERLFEDFEARFLHRDVEGGFARRLLNPRHWPRAC